MQIPSKYAPSQTEDKWYAYWTNHKLFRSVPDERQPYTIVIPPPNVTGVLHMGHMLNNTLQDVMIRRKRMQGFNALWLPGTDHASIATEARVVNKLREEGIEKSSLSREEFLQHAWHWREKHGGIILEQLKKLGASCDWERTKFTMDPDMYESVIDVFIDLYNKGLIYRGVRMVNWDPKALTAVSDEEVVYKEVQSKLYYVRYFLQDNQEDFITIATTRPETILGDTAVCVHPEDERFKRFHGKKVVVPLVNRPVPIIIDEYVDREFGTGALKITPAHDINDYNLGLKHHLPSIDIFNDDGSLNYRAGLFIGEDRFVVRKKIVPALEEKGHIVKIEDYLNKLGFSERTDEVIEPKLSLQWFMKMSELARPALDVVMNETIGFHPAKFRNTYRHWMENVHDWCISRQLWWGQRIPVYYLEDGRMVVAKSSEEALQKARTEYNLPLLQKSDLRQDEDVLDTWFSSWLWPISVFDGIRHPDNPEIAYYYPTNDLITAPEILFFWVARMIMAGLEYRNEIPFRNVYLTGIVRDKLGRKMSKSLGNSPDPLDLIKVYGADGVRAGMLFTSPAGNDLPFDEALCEQGRNFSNKIWNALRLVQGWEHDPQAVQPDYAVLAVKWFEARFNQAFVSIEEHFERYRISDALMGIYKLIWDDFCSVYLEVIKPPYGSPIDLASYNASIVFFERLMKVLHPFMPFITEEIYHHLHERAETDSIMISEWPEPKAYDEDIIRNFASSWEIISGLRNLRASRNIPQKEALHLIRLTQEAADRSFDPVIIKLCNLSSLQDADHAPEGALSFVAGTVECFIPGSNSINVDEELAKLRAELDYTLGFKASVLKKLQNERFVQGAPAQVVDNENKKLSDAEARISALTKQIDILQK